MKFKTLKAYNLYSFPALDFKFNFRGTTLIIGRSDDENTANGSGKTSIIKILYLGLWGKELYDATLDSVKYRNATDGWLIEIEFEHRGHNYKIVRYRDRKHRDDKVQESKSGVEFYSDGQPYPGEGPSEIQKGIEATLGLSPKLFKSSVLTAQGEQKHFLTVSDTEKKEIFSELLDLTIYSSSFNFVKKEIDALEEKIKAVEQKIEDGNNRIKDKNEEIAKFQAEEDNFEDKKIISVNLLTAKKAKLNLEIDQLKQSNLESSALLEKEKELLQVLEDKVKAKLEFSAGLEEEEATAEVHLEYSGKLSSIRSEGESVSNQKKDAESELAKLIKRKANPSDLDRKVIDLKSSATVVESLLPGVSNYQSEISHLTSAAFSVCSLFDTDTEEKIEELNKKISKLNLDREQKLKSYSEVKEKVTKLKESLDKFKIQKDRISNLDKEINKLNQDLKIIAEKKKKIENIEPEVNAKLQLIEEANSQIEQEKLKNNPFKDILDVAKKRV
jgi:DNA repair exonuclease SbcCD ATPase subunit